MGFLSGSITCERFWITKDPTPPLGQDHLKILEKFAIDRIKPTTPEEPCVGFFAGDHLFDQHFDLEKNVIDESIHFGIRIDTNQVPSAIRKAWLHMELAAAMKDQEPGARPTKVQRQEAKESVEARCLEESKSGRFRRMQQLPVLWNAGSEVLYIGGSSASAIEPCVDLLERAFEIELSRMTSGKIAAAHASESKQLDKLNEIMPAVFHNEDASTDITWWNGHGDNYDFLGNEFLLWLWWKWDTEADTLDLPDGSEVTGMFARTLSLECPRGESGKETISDESPVRLPEAALAIQSGKLPRRAGLTLARHGSQYDLSLQAESFTIGGARIQTDEEAESDNYREDRVKSIEEMAETLDLLFISFIERRMKSDWKKDLKQMRGWLQSESNSRQKTAA